MKKQITFLASILIILPFFVIAQDLDQDGLNDALEEALARRFAPEWRFHKEVPNDGSNQNETELYYPAGIEWFYNKVVEVWGQPPNLIWNIPNNQLSYVTPITDINNLDNMQYPDPNSNITSSDNSWGDCTSVTGNGDIRMDYPKEIPGDPEGFSTYFHCNKVNDNGMISIGYLLFYPYDYKGSYVGLTFGDHRGDWEGVNILISGVGDYGDPASADNAVIVRVKFSGHGVSKYIDTSSPRFRSVWATHPKVYIAFGSHTTYPEPGEWHNFKTTGPNVYDDFFHGNGVVVQSWQPQRQLTNMGETAHPMVGWLNYKGWWGPDDNGGNSSPPSPPCKSAWDHNVSGYVTWEEALLSSNYDPFWEDPFDLDCSPELAAWYYPDPNYGCNIYVDCRVTCAGENPPFFTVNFGVAVTPVGGVLGIFPCRYPENITINKAITLKAIEGTVIIGEY